MKVIQNWNSLKIKLEFLFSEVYKIQMEKALRNLFWIQLMLFWGVGGSGYLFQFIGIHCWCAACHFSSHLTAVTCLLPECRVNQCQKYTKQKQKGEQSTAHVLQLKTGCTTQAQSLHRSRATQRHCWGFHCFFPCPVWPEKHRGSRSTVSSPVTDHGLPKQKTDEQKLLAVPAGTLHASAARRIKAAASEGMQPLCLRQRQHFWGHQNSQAMAVELSSLDRSQYLTEG